MCFPPSRCLRALGDEVRPDFSHERVCVIGGGNVAMDVARSAIRLGAKKVTIVYRRRVADMTAQDEEIAGAKAEGCELLELHAPIAIESQDGYVTGLRVQRQIIGGLSRGRFAPRQADRPRGGHSPASVWWWPLARPSSPGPSRSEGVALQARAHRGGEDSAVPGMDGVFSGGDCQGGPATVIRAVNAGKVAAGNIDNYLGFNHQITLDVDLPPVQFKGKTSCARCEMTLREAEDRKRDFDLIENGLDRGTRPTKRHRGA